MPIPTSVIDNLLDKFNESFIRCLSLAITLRVVWCGPPMLDIEFGIKGFDVIIFKRLTIISDDG